MTRIGRLLLIMGLSLGTAGRLQAQSAPLLSDEAIRAILVERVDVQRRHVGIIVGILTPSGRRVIAHGRATANGTLPLTADTVFEIGSVTKVFTSALLAAMTLRGEVSLGDAVGTYVPEIAAGSPAAAITLTDLATHTARLPLWPSGIPATRDGAMAMGRYTEPQLFGFLSSFPVPADVGKRWEYSNVDAGVLGLALARRARTTFEELVQARIARPLSMAATRITVTPSMKPRLAAGFDASLAPAPPWSAPALEGAGSLHSTVNDLLTFLDAFDRGRTDGSSPLAGVLETMLSVKRPGPGIPQALAWWMLSAGPGDAGIVTHDGGTLGFTSAMAYDLASRSGVVVLSNTANGVGDIARHLLRPAIPLSRPPAAAPQKTEIPLDPRVFDRYVGRYEPGPGMVFMVERDGDALMIQLPGVPRLRLRPESDVAFFVAENTRLTVTFEVGGDHRATGLFLRSPAGDTAARRIGD